MLSCSLAPMLLLRLRIDSIGSWLAPHYNSSIDEFCDLRLQLGPPRRLNLCWEILLRTTSCGLDRANTSSTSRREKHYALMTTQEIKLINRLGLQFFLRFQKVQYNEVWTSLFSPNLNTPFIGATFKNTVSTSSNNFYFS